MDTGPFARAIFCLYFVDLLQALGCQIFWASFATWAFHTLFLSLSSQQLGVLWDPGTRVLPDLKTSEFFQLANLSVRE